MPLVPAKCTQCGATIKVDDTKESGICENCGTPFLTEKVTNNYNINNNFNIENANIIVSGTDIEKKICAAEKLINNGMISDGRVILYKITKEFPEDYRAWFLLSKYEWQYEDLWFDDNPKFHKAKALADDENLKKIVTHYDEMASLIVENSVATVVDFCKNADLTKLYYCYIKWYYSESYVDEERYGYWGLEPVNGCPTLVDYAKNDKFGYVRRELASNLKVLTKLYEKKLVGVIVNEENRCCFLPDHVKNEFTFHWGDGVLDFDTCRMYISDFNGDKVVYNYNPSEMVYGDVFKDKSTDFEKTGGACYVATCVYGSYNCPEVWTLRRFRDNTLAKTWIGRFFVRAYYAVSPTIVKWFGDTKWFKKICHVVLDKMVNNLRSNGVKDTPYQDKDWR